MAKPPKIQLSKIAMEIVFANKAAMFVPDAKTMKRDELLVAVEAVVHTDFREMTDTVFRRKYLTFIRTYWGGEASYFRRVR